MTEPEKGPLPQRRTQEDIEGERAAAAGLIGGGSFLLVSGAIALDHSEAASPEEAIGSVSFDNSRDFFVTTGDLPGIGLIALGGAAVAGGIKYLRRSRQHDGQ
jgi:hypothetical protein